MKKLKRYESGSIMLEVVAVLALMGVMGAMLFRQIYQRNQELHNIQMASEIRTVKEAFSAYIQANRSAIVRNCPDPAGGVKSCGDSRDADGNYIFDDYDGVADYLPDGWFVGDSDDPDYLGNAYILTLWNYENNADERVIYGIVVPTDSTLPTTGWNFRRAARVALLIGADGGAYDPTITKCSFDADGNGDQDDDCIAGTLGSWEIEASDTGINPRDYPHGTYVATTGIDIFSPEYEMPQGKVAIPFEWDLALHNLHAYNYFSVGNSGTGNCYVITPDTSDNNKRSYRGTGENAILENDTVHTELSAACKPLFWVGSQSGADDHSAGNVYVATDLKIGDIVGNTHNEALTLTKEGVIKQKDGITIDKDGRIIAKETVSGDIGDLKQGEHFVVDPAYTSTMNDIRLTSRGGVRLSDILPNYILKEQKSIAGETSYTITEPSCPTGYTKGLVIIPTVWPGGVLGVEIPQLDVDMDSKKTASENVNVKGVCVSSIVENSGEWQFYLGVHDGTSCSSNQEISAIVQTYCAWTPSLYDGDQPKCEAAGYDYSGGKCITTHAVDTTMDGAVVGAERSQEACEGAGFTWVSESGHVPAHCQYKYNLTSINAIDALSLKRTICKNAGWTWDDTNTTCSCPSGSGPYCSSDS